VWLRHDNKGNYGFFRSGQYHIQAKGFSGRAGSETGPPLI
jgi:hypothetical protein